MSVVFSCAFYGEMICWTRNPGQRSQRLRRRMEVCQKLFFVENEAADFFCASLYLSTHIFFLPYPWRWLILHLVTRALIHSSQTKTMNTQWCSLLFFILAFSSPPSSDTKPDALKAGRLKAHWKEVATHPFSTSNFSQIPFNRLWQRHKRFRIARFLKYKKGFK